MKSVYFLVFALFLLVISACSSNVMNVGAANARLQQSRSSAGIERYFDGIKQDPVALRSFLADFPKGADLHSHLSGAVYAESYIRWALQADLCVYVEIHTLNACPDDVAEEFADYTQRKLDEQLTRDPQYRYRLIDAFSVRNFVQSHGGPSGADQFFASFDRFDAATVGNRPAMLAEVMNRAGAQNIGYLELMMSPAPGTFLGMGAGLDWSGDPSAMEAALLGRDFLQAVTAASAAFADDMAAARELMACDTAQPAPGCAVKVRILAQALRDLDDIGSVFALIMACFYVAADSDLVAGVNFVMREDGPYALRDYAEHMRIMAYFTDKFPSVNLALHAGELTLGLVPPEELGNHIELALASGARRIGHGIDIGYEENALQTLERMAQEEILVEINLSSNAAILGVSGAHHPFMRYRSAGVPVALSTDDEGVLRIDLTHEYARAVLTYDLDYAELKQLARNSVAYSFLPGDEKAEQLEALEQSFIDFESAPPALIKRRR